MLLYARSKAAADIHGCMMLPSDAAGAAAADDDDDNDDDSQSMRY